MPVSYDEDLIKRLKEELKDPLVTVREALRRCGVDVDNFADYKAAWDYINRRHVIGRRIVKRPRVTQAAEAKR
jgi:hypothetical protein